MSLQMMDNVSTWVGGIPESWSVTKLKRITNKLSRPLVANDQQVVCTNKGTVVPRGEKNAGLVSMTEDGYQGVRPGDLLIHGMDTWHGAIAISSITGKCTSVVHVCDSQEDKRFLAYYLRALAFRGVYKAFSNGVRQNTSDFRSWSKAGEIPVILPATIEGQKRIADYLDAKCAEIDKAIAAAESSIEEYKAYQYDLISRTVTKGLGKTSLKVTGLEWLGEVPADWKPARLKTLYRVISYDNHPSEELLSVYLNRGVIRYSDSDGSQVHKPSDSLAKYQLVMPGNLVLNNQQAWRGSVGISNYRGIISPAYYVLEKLNSNLVDRYMNYLFRGPFVPVFEQCSKGVGSIQRNVDVSKVLSEYVYIPSVSEQDAMADFLDAKCEEIASVIESKQAIIEDLKAYKQSLIYEVVTGKKEV